MAFGFAAFGLQKIIADVGAGNVNIAADALQQARPEEKVLANIVVRLLDFTERADPIELGEGHQGQQAAKPGDEEQAAAHGNCAVARLDSHSYYRTPGKA